MNLALLSFPYRYLLSSPPHPFRKCFSRCYILSCLAALTCRTGRVSANFKSKGVIKIHADFCVPRRVQDFMGSDKLIWNLISRGEIVHIAVLSPRSSAERKCAKITAVFLPILGGLPGHTGKFIEYMNSFLKCQIFILSRLLFWIGCILHKTAKHD